MDPTELRAALRAIRSLRREYRPLGRIGCVVVACIEIRREAPALRSLPPRQREDRLTLAAQIALATALEATD